MGVTPRAGTKAIPVGMEKFYAEIIRKRSGRP